MKDDDALCAALLRVGEPFAGRYVLDDLIGVGGMGLVYSATTVETSDSVAIKMPWPKVIDDPYVRRRFRAEATAGARIDHPNVAQLLDAGEWCGCPYIVMEQVNGRSLGAVARESGPMPAERALPLYFQMLSALSTMHRQGIVHGDVKPENALVSVDGEGEGRLKLIDLGLAHFVDDRGDSATDGMVSGTPEYLAPELSSGGSPSFAADQYAACVTLYELLAGAPPFTADSPQAIAAAHVAGVYLPLTDRCPTLRDAAAIDRIVRRGLSRRPCDRFPDLPALAGELRRTTQLTFGWHATPVTAEWKIPPRVSLGRDTARVAANRRILRQAIATSQIETVVDAAFRLAAALVEQGRISCAIAELELVLDSVAGRNNNECTHARWRLELTLAALYDAHGERARARQIVSDARAHARDCGSTSGVLRCATLLARLMRSRERTTQKNLADVQRS